MRINGNKVHSTKIHGFSLSYCMISQDIYSTQGFRRTNKIYLLSGYTLKVNTRVVYLCVLTDRSSLWMRSLFWHLCVEDTSSFMNLFVITRGSYNMPVHLSACFCDVAMVTLFTDYCCSKNGPAMQAEANLWMMENNEE